MTIAGLLYEGVGNAISARGSLPICVDNQNFLPMIRHADGRFICPRCGHVRRPEDADFSCNCGKCVALARFCERSRPVHAS